MLHFGGMKLAAWNVNSLKVRLPQLLDFLATRNPDVVCLQETKLTDDNFPVAELEAAGYRAVFAGQKTYNGVAIVSRSEPVEVQVGIPNLEDEQKRVIAATVDGVRVVCVYCPNGQSLDSDKYPYKLAWFDALAAWLKQELARFPRLAVLGDYNIAPEDRDVHDPEAWKDSVLVSEPERERFRPAGAGFERQLPPVRAARKTLQLVGLPHDGIPPQPRLAYRPHPAVPTAGGGLHRQHRRPRHAQTGAAVGPRPGGGVRPAQLSLNFPEGPRVLQEYGS
jgi:exodeoxyribonuclease III